jgi:hypothetical protein
MRARRLAPLLLLVSLAACSGLRRDGARPPVRDVAAAVAVDAYRSGLDLLEVVAWRAPKLVLLELPAWLFYEAPRSLLLAASGDRTKVEAGIERLRAGGEPEEMVETVTDLRELTGLPMEDAAAWLAWWETAKDRPESAWKADLADRCIADLRSDDFLVRQQADDRLRALSGIDAGFDAKAPEEERLAAIGRWTAWRDELGGSE